MVFRISYGAADNYLFARLSVCYTSAAIGRRVY